MDEKEYLGEQALIRLLTLIKSELDKYVKTEVHNDIETALDNIIEIQNSLMGSNVQ